MALRRNTIDDVVMALADAPVDERTGNKVLYSVDWLADKPSMIGEVNPDWVRRELNWFSSGSDSLADLEGPVPKLFQACAGTDGKVNSAYGHILFGKGAFLPPVSSLYDVVLETFTDEGLDTRHAVAIISDRDVRYISRYNDRHDFICTNALNFMVDSRNRLNIIAQMRSMDAVFGYRADYSMWDYLMNKLVRDLNDSDSYQLANITRGDITFQVANLHVYPRHHQLLADTAADIDERLQRRVWRSQTIMGSDGRDHDV
jgi:hypothetical protein